jgi:hypothetical protein
MSHKEEANLFRHYGIGYGTAGPLSGKPVSRGAGRTTRGLGVLGLR